MTCKEQGQTHCWRTLARAFAFRAAVLCALFLVVHLLGFRRYTSFLSGTATLDYLPLLGGAVYILLYILFVVGVPVLLIAAALAKALEFSNRKGISLNPFRKTAGEEK
jgi:hypothetical protein